MIRKLFISLVVLFVAMAAQAQHITDAKLLGTWKLKAMQVGEIYADFEKDSISYDKDWINNTDSDIEKQTRQLIIKGLRDAVVQTSGSITFHNNGTYSLTMLPDVVNHVEKYNLIYDGKKNYIITGKKQERIGLKITGRTLYWQITEEGQTMELIFEKNK